MSKNAIIGLLVAIVIIGGGYYLMTTNNQSATTSQTTIPSDSKTPTVPVVSPPLVLSAPTVTTNSNYSTSVSTALVNGTVVPNGLSTAYWFEYGETASLGNKTTRQQIGSGFYGISSPGYIAGLRTSTVYYFRLSAANNFGTINGSTYTLQTNNNPAPTAAMPTVTTNNANYTLRTSTNLNGQVNPKGFPANYWFEYGKNSNLGNITTITSTTSSTSVSTISIPVSGLEPLTKYYFRLNAQNQFGTVNGNILSFSTEGPLNPGAPTIVATNQVSNITNSSARLNGRINPNGAETTYWFEYSNDSLLNNLIGNGTPIQTINAGTSVVSVQATVAGLNKKTKYFYHLIAKSQYGTIYGSINSFTTKP